MNVVIIMNSFSYLYEYNVSIRPSTKKKKRKFDEEDTLEEDYEKDAPETKKLRGLLPLKTKDGIIRQEVEVVDEEPEDQEALGSDQDENETGLNGSEDGNESDASDYTLNDDEGALDVSKPVSTAQLLASRNEVLRQKKIHIGSLSAGLLENPEEKIVNLRSLLKILDEECPEVHWTVKKLGVVSLLEVFKDLLPSYEIKHHENNKEVKCKSLAFILPPITNSNSNVKIIIKLFYENYNNFIIFKPQSNY